MLGNWIRQTTTTTGTGNLTLAAVTGFPQFTDQFSTTEYFYYAILNDSDGTPIESGIGHLSSSTVLVRDKVLATYVSGTYSDNDPSAVSLAAGTKRVICAMEQGGAQPVAPNINSVTSYRLLYPTGWIVGGSAPSAAVIADIVYYVPILIACPRTLDAIQFRVSSVGAGSSVIVGIYNSTLDGKPNSRIDQSASIATHTAAGVKVGALTKRRYKPGLYFLALSATGGTPTLNQGSASGQVNHIFGGDINMLASIVAFYESTTAGALPATAGVTSGVRMINETPLLALRVA